MKCLWKKKQHDFELQLLAGCCFCEMTYDFKRLRTIMNVHRWTIGRMAFVLSLDPERLKKGLNGTARISRKDLERICGLLEVDIAEFEITEFTA